MFETVSSSGLSFLYKLIVQGKIRVNLILHCMKRFNERGLSKKTADL